MIKIKLKIKNSKLKIAVGFSSKMKSGIAPLILVIVIGIVLAAGGLGLGLAWKAGLFGKPGGGPSDGTTTNGTQPQPPPSNGEEDPTKDWKVYTNEKYGYSIKYPKDWTVEIGNRGNDIRPEDMVSFNTSDGEGAISVSVESSAGMGAREFIDTVIMRELVPEAFGAEYEVATLDGFDAVRVEYNFGPQGPEFRFVYAAIVKNGYGYYIETIHTVAPGTDQPLDEVDRMLLQTFEEMLTTFKFI